MRASVCPANPPELFKCGDEFLFIHTERSEREDPKGKVQNNTGGEQERERTRGDE